MFSIPFNKPYLAGNEMHHIREVFENRHFSGDGLFTKKCHEILEKYLAAHRAFLTTSGTHALEMCAMLIDIKAGDEVILPSYTFPSTANAFVLQGAVPVFVDIKSDTLNLDPDKLVEKINSRTKAIVPVHYAGVACEMDTILSIAKDYNLKVIEDNAHGLFGKYKGQYLGTLGDLGAQSFHETKNISCGEGGALIVNDPELITRAEVIREKGTNRNAYFRGEVDKYTWVEKGSSYLPSEILAAFLFAQLEAKEKIQELRKRIWNYYYHELQDWVEQHHVQLPYVPEYSEQAYHMFYIILPTASARRLLQAHLKSKNILSIFHYQPLHLSFMGKTFGGKEADCPVTEKISECLLRLPFYNDLTEEDQAFVVKAVKEFTF